MRRKIITNRFLILLITISNNIFLIPLNDTFQYYNMQEKIYIFRFLVYNELSTEGEYGRISLGNGRY